MNNLLSITALTMGVLQLLMALFWLLIDRRHTFTRWFAVAVALFGVTNILSAVADLYIEQVRQLGIAHVIVTPLLPIAFIGGTLALVAPQTMQRGSRVRRILLGLGVGTFLLAAVDTLFALGVYYNPRIIVPQTLNSYIQDSFQPVVLIYIFSAILIPLILTITALLRRWAPEYRSLHVLFLAFLVGSDVIGFSIDLVLPHNSTRLLSTFVLTGGLFMIMMSLQPDLLDRFGRLGTKLPIATKLGWSFGAILFLTVIVGLLSIYSIFQLNALVQQTLSTQNHLATEAAELLDAYRSARRYERDFAIQARTDGIREAFISSHESWQENIDSMELTLAHLRRDLSDLPPSEDQQAQTEKLRVIANKYQEYISHANTFFATYERRGDVDGGALAQWIHAAEALDTLLNSNPVANRDFNERFVDLRNNQFYYLATENTNIGRDVRTLYDDLQRFVLFEQLETPLSVRTEVQIKLEEEAVAFDTVRDTTHELNLVSNQLEGASSSLENDILAFADQASRDFDQGVQTISQRRLFSIISIVVILLFGLGLGFLLARIASRQITVPVLALANAANEMAAGRQGVRAEVLSQDEIGTAASAFNTMASRLDGLLFTLEERVARRTAQLETAASVAAAASAVRDLAQLLDQTTSLLVERFTDIYHAQVFLVDQQGEGEWAVLRSSTGEAGQKLLARQHRLQVGSQSVIGQVTSTGEHVLARTFDPYSVHRPNDLLPDTKSELALPMRRGNRVIGTLDVQSTRPYAFSEDDVAVLQTLADQLTIAVENARLFRNLGSTIDETERLFRASSGLAGAGNSEEVFDIFTSLAASLQQFDRLSILMFDEFDADGHPLGARSVRTWIRDGGAIETRNRFDITAVINEIWTALEEGILEVTDVTRYALIDPRTYEVLTELGTQSFTLVPLETAGNYLGLILLHRRERGAIPESAARIFRVLAQQAAVALNRFGLLGQLSQRVDELQQLRESFLDLGSSASLDVLLQSLANRATVLLGAHGSFIYLYNEAQDVMELTALYNLDETMRGSRLKRGEGAVGHLISQREPFVVDNYARWRGRSDQIPQNERYGAVAAVPLLWQNRLMGALAVVNLRDQRRFTQDDLRRLTLFADQAAVTLENARLLREAERSLKETTTLYTCSQALLSASGEREMLRAIVDNLSGDEKDVVMVVHTVAEQDPPKLEVVAVNDVQIIIRTVPERRVRHTAEMFPLGTLLPGTLLVPVGVDVWESTSRIVEDLASNTVPELAHLARTNGFHSLMTVPIYTREGFYGAVIMLRRHMNPFSQEELARTSTIASQFAVAYDNILLLQESKRAADKLATAAQVSRSASMQLDVDEVLTRAVELVREQFQYYHVQVFLVDEANLWAELRASSGEIGRKLLAQRHRLGVGSRSVIGQVTATGQYVVARSTDVDPKSIHRRNELLLDTRAELALPMKVGDEVIGALDVQSTDPFAFVDQADVDILQTLADQLAVAVQNARLFERTQESLIHSQSLYHAGRAIASASSLEDILKAVIEYVAPKDTFDLSILSVGLNEEGIPEQIRVAASIFPGRPGVTMAGRVFPIAPEQRFIIDTLQQAKETVAIHDIASDSRLDPLSQAMYTHLGISAGVLVPLTKVEGRQFVLQAALAHARHISQSEIERLGTIATQASIAIQNLYLLDNLEKRAQRLNETNLLSSKLLAIPSLSELLDVAAQEVTTIMEVDRAGIIFLEQNKEVGRIVSQYQDGEKTEHVGDWFKIDRQIIEWLEANREPLVIPRLETALILGQTLPILESHKIRSLMISPLFVRGEMIAVIDLVSITRARDWSDIDVSLAQTLTNLVASAIESTRLFEQVRLNLEQTQALYRASRSINEAATLNEIAAAIAEHVVAVPEASVSLIALALDANELIRSAQVEGAFIPGSDGSGWQRVTFSDSILPVLRSLDLNREALVVPTLQEDTRLTPRERRMFQLMRISAIMSVPIRLADGWTGVILVTYPTPHAISTSDLDRLSAIATQAATTMQNRELLTQTQESLLESQLLYQAGAGINEAETLEGLLQALHPLAEPIDPDQVVLLLFDEPVLEGERPINFTALAGLNLREELIPLGQTYRVRDFPIFRRLPVVAPLVFEDVQSSDMVSDEERRALKQLQLRSLLYLPLRIGTRYMGWIGFNASGPRLIQENVVRRLQNITQQAATALQSQQLFQEAQRRAWREEQISRITARLHSTTDPEEIMRIGLQELKRTLNIKRAMAWVQGEEGHGPGRGSGNGANNGNRRS